MCSSLLSLLLLALSKLTLCTHARTFSIYNSNSLTYLGPQPVPTKFMCCLWDHLVDSCQLRLKAGSHPTPSVSSPASFFTPCRQGHHLPVTQPITWLSSLPPASPQSPTARPSSPHTLMVAVLPCLQAARALLPRLSSLPGILTVPLLSLQPFLGFFWTSAPSLALQCSCSLHHLTRHLSSAAEAFHHPTMTCSFPCSI